MVSQIATNVQAQGIQPSGKFIRDNRHTPVTSFLFQVNITNGGAATVALEGSCDNSIFIQIATFTVTAAQAVTAFPYLRVNVTSYTGPAIINAFIAE